VKIWPLWLKATRRRSHERREKQPKTNENWIIVRTIGIYRFLKMKSVGVL
jgi:ribosomal protein S19E (S16A)